MARPKATAPAPKIAKTVEQFCEDYGISRRTFENWEARGAAPEITQPVPGGRKLITRESEEAWKQAHTGRRLSSGM